MPKRRRVLALIAVAATLPRPALADVLSAPQAQAAAARGALLLVDIRRPDEWADTGIPVPAHPLDMRDPGFTEALLRLAGGDPGRPVALICAGGVRSARLAADLRRAGFTAVADVAEGVLGSPAGPGWVARGLPLTRP